MTTSREVDHPFRLFESAVRHIQDGLNPMGELQETTSVKAETFEGIAQIFAREVQEGAIELHLPRLLEDIQGIKHEEVYGLGIVALDGRMLSLRVIAERESHKYVPPITDAYRKFCEAFYNSSPETRVSTNVSFYGVDGLDSLQPRLLDIQNRIRREEGVSAMALIIFQKPS